MANGIALIVVAALAVLGAYYIVEVLAASTLPKKVNATVVLPYLAVKFDMAAALVAVLGNCPGCTVLVLCEEEEAACTVPFQNSGRVQVLKRAEVAAYIENNL